MQQQMQQRHPYLFYSQKCKNCVQLINYIQQYKDFASSIELINVHQIPRDRLPKELKGVPAILHNGQFHIGADTFKWAQFHINMMNQQNKQGNQQQNQQGMQEQRPSMQQGNVQNGMQSGVNPGEPEAADCIGGKCAVGFDFLDDNILGKNDSKMTYDIFNESIQDGTKDIDVMKAQDQKMMGNKKDKGMSAQFEQLQKLRGMNGV